MTEELKPCPFCGTNPKNGVFAGTYCSNEGCAIFEVEFSGGAQSWNRRATPAPAQPEPKGTTLDEKSPVKSPAEGAQEDEPVMWQGRRAYHDAPEWDEWAYIHPDNLKLWKEKTVEKPHMFQLRALYAHPSRAILAAAPKERP